MTTWKRIPLASFLVAALISTASGPFSSSAEAQERIDPKKGWLEGRVRNAEGTPVTAFINCSGTNTHSDREFDGLYVIKDMPPGTYECQVKKDGYRPQRIFGVVVKPGVRTVFNIKIERGEGLQEIGKPAVATEPVVIIHNELAKLQKQVDELKSEVAKLKAKVK